MTILVHAEELACTTTASAWAGLPWRSEFALFNTESMWQRHGAPKSVQILYDTSSGCVRGLRTSYSGVTKLLGSDALLGAPGTLASSELSLDEGETVIQAAVNSGRCESDIADCCHNLKFCMLHSNGCSVLQCPAAADTLSAGTWPGLSLVYPTAVASPT